MRITPAGERVHREVHLSKPTAALLGVASLTGRDEILVPSPGEAHVRRQSCSVNAPALRLMAAARRPAGNPGNCSEAYLERARMEGQLKDRLVRAATDIRRRLRDMSLSPQARASLRERLRQVEHGRAAAEARIDAYTQTSLDLAQEQARANAELEERWAVYEREQEAHAIGQANAVDYDDDDEDNARLLTAAAIGIALLPFI